MFGLSPEIIQAQLQAEEEKRALEMSKLSPMQEARYRMMRAGTGLGNATAGLLNQYASPKLGGQIMFGKPEDPRLTEAKKLLEVKKGLQESGIDPEDIDKFYPEMIRRLNAAGFPEQASNMMKQYTQAQTNRGNLEARKSELSIRETEAETRRLKALQEKRERDLPGLSILKSLIETIKTKPENAALVSKFRDSITKDNPTGDLSLLEDLQVKDNFNNNPIAKDEEGNIFYRDKNGTYKIDMILDPVTKGVVQFKNYTTAKEAPKKPLVEVNMGPKIEEKNLDFLKDIKAPAAKDFQVKSTLAYETRGNINKLVNIAEQAPLILGTGADFRLKLAEFFDTLGVKGFKESASTSQLLDTLVGPQILANMQKLGGQDSNEELRKITAMSPNRALTRPTLIHLTKVLQAEINRQVLRDENLSQFLSAGGKPLEFNFSRGYQDGQRNPEEVFPVPLIDTESLITYNSKKEYESAQKGKRLRNMSDEELRKALRERNKE